MGNSSVKRTKTKKTVLNVLKKKKINKKKTSKEKKVACLPKCAFCTFSAFMCVKFSRKKKEKV